MSRLKANKIIKTINKGIAVNPTQITFTQLTKKLVDGAWEKEKAEKNIIVLIYLDDASSTSININSGAKGTSYSTKRYKMMADKDAGLEINPENAIKFKCLEGNMEIKGVYIIQVENIICGYICDLERID